MDENFSLVCLALLRGWGCWRWQSFVRPGPILDYLTNSRIIKKKKYLPRFCSVLFEALSLYMPVFLFFFFYNYWDNCYMGFVSCLGCEDGSLWFDSLALILGFFTCAGQSVQLKTSNFLLLLIELLVLDPFMRVLFCVFFCYGC
jgi:hypothetical protein